MYISVRRFDALLRSDGGKIECARANFTALAVGANLAIHEKLKDVEGLLTYEAKR